MAVIKIFLRLPYWEAAKTKFPLWGGGPPLHLTHYENIRFFLEDENNYIFSYFPFKHGEERGGGQAVAKTRNCFFV